MSFIGFVWFAVFFWSLRGFLTATVHTKLFMSLDPRAKKYNEQEKAAFGFLMMVFAFIYLFVSYWSLTHLLNYL